MNKKKRKFVIFLIEKAQLFADFLLQRRGKEIEVAKDYELEEEGVLKFIVNLLEMKLLKIIF